MISIAVHHVARQRQGLAGDREPDGHLHGRRLERQPPPRGRHPGPVVQGARQRSSQEVGLRPWRIGRHGDGEATRRETPRRHGGTHGVEPLDLPPGWRPHLDPVERHGRFPGVPDARFQLDALTGNQDAVVREAVDHDARRRGEGLLENRLLPGIRGAELTQGAPEQRSDHIGSRGVELRAGRIDQPGVAGFPRKQGVHIGEQTVAIFRPAPSIPPLDERQPTDPRPRFLELALVLRAVLAPARHGDLVVRSTLHGVEHSRIEPQRGAGGIEVQGAVQLHRSPARVTQRLERLARDQAGHLVLAVPVARGSGEHGHDDLGTEPAHDVEHILKHGIAGPEPQRFVQRLGIPEVVGAREELAGAVDAPGGEQLFRADDAELGAELGTDEVLPSFAAAQRQVGHLRAHPPGEQGDEVRVLVVGVGADHQDPLVRTELLERARQRRDAAGAGWSELPHDRPDGAEQQSKASPERAPHYGER